MGLVNEETHYDWQGNISLSSVSLFEQSKRRLKEKKQQLADMQNEYDLLEMQSLNLYRSHVRYINFMPKFIEATQRWLEALKTGLDSNGKKIDKRKKYDDKNLYNYMVEFIGDILGLDDFELESISDYNFGEAYIFKFTSHGHKWNLQVPRVASISLKSFQHYGESCFLMTLGHWDSDYALSQFGKTFIEEELKDIMAAGIEKYCGDKQ